MSAIDRGPALASMNRTTYNIPLARVNYFNRIMMDLIVKVCYQPVIDSELCQRSKFYVHHGPLCLSYSIALDGAVYHQLKGCPLQFAYSVYIQNYRWLVTRRMYACNLRITQGKDTLREFRRGTTFIRCPSSLLSGLLNRWADLLRGSHIQMRTCLSAQTPTHYILCALPNGESKPSHLYHGCSCILATVPGNVTLSHIPHHSSVPTIETI